MNAQIMKRNILLAVIGRVISDMGSALFRFGLSLYILDLTGSAAAFSGFLIFSVLPGLVVNIFAGALIDRASKKRILILSDAASGISVLIFMFIFNANPAEMGVFLAYTIFLGLIQAFFALSLNSSIPELVTEDSVNKANSSFQSVGAIISILGPVLGAVAYTSLGLTNLFIIDGISFIIAAVLESRLVYRREKIEQVTGKPKTNLLEDVKEVFRYLGSQKGMIYMLVMVVSLNLFFVPMLVLVLPYVCYQVVGVTGLQLSLIQGSWAAGLILGAILMGRIKDNRPVMSKLFNMLTVSGLLFIPWMFPAIFPGMGKWFISIIYIAILIVSAVLNSCINIPAMTFVQTTTPESLRGRFFGVLFTCSTLATPIGYWIYGLILENVNWIWAPVLSTAAVIICSLVSSRSRHMNAMIREYQNSGTNKNEPDSELPLADAEPVL